MSAPVRRSSLLVPAKGLGPLDAAAVWILAALRHLAPSAPRQPADPERWVELFEDLLEHARLIRDAGDSPANRCGLVPVRMPVAVDAWPKPGEAIPVEFEDRQLWAIDNRRLVGVVAMTLVGHIAVYRAAAVRYGLEAERSGSEETWAKADGYALQVQVLGLQAMRGVDLAALDRAVDAEIDRAPASPTAKTVTSVQPPAVTVEFPSDDLAIVSEGATSRKVKGQRRVWLLRQVFEADGKAVTWIDLVRADLHRAGDLAGTRDQDDPMPRLATNPASFQRLGAHIRRSLGKLGYLWEQDGHGARWKSDAR